MEKHAAFKVQGLDCAEEVAILKKEIGGKDGIRSLDFDILNARMSVKYDADRISPDSIVASVGATGMRAIPWEVAGEDVETSFWQRQGRLVTTGASGVFLVGGFISHWFKHGNFLEVLIGGEGSDGHIFPLLSIGLYMAAIIAGAWFVIPKAISAARRFRPDMNFLMTVAVIGAVVIGEWLEGATVSFLFAISLLLEQWSVSRARRAIGSLMDLSPGLCRYICPNDGDILEKRVEEVPLGVTALVRPGEKFPLDGEVKKGTSTVNQAPITGESIPVRKEPGDIVYAGTVNGDGSLEFEVTKSANDTTLARIIHLVQESQSRRAPSEQWVEKFARYYTPAMMILAITLAFAPPLLFGAPLAEWLYRGLVVLVIACPCALVISTPVSIVSALTTAARQGVLVKGGKHLEEAGHLRAIALDKTGTLTQGRPEVQEIVPLNGHSIKELLERAAALERHSEHPLAKAILQKADALEIPVLSAENFQAIKGKGGTGTIEGRTYWIGSHRLMHEMGGESEKVHAHAAKLEDAGHSVVCIGNAKHVCGLISVADRVRDNAKGAVQAMKRHGIMKVLMLTGDNEGTAREIARLTGVDEYRSGLLPEDKSSAVESLVREYNHVAMVGDGVNDAPAMALASLGIAMGAIGTDAAIETADIALMSDDLTKIPWLIYHSRRTLSVIKQNIFFALGLKILFIGLALFGMASLWMAIAADMGASLIVIFNALRLLDSGKKICVAVI